MRTGISKGFGLAAIALLALALSLSACGRRGPLERPTTAQTTDNGEPGEAQVAERPRRPFILDGLLQ